MYFKHQRLLKPRLFVFKTPFWNQNVLLQEETSSLVLEVVKHRLAGHVGCEKANEVI